MPLVESEIAEWRRRMSAIPTLERSLAELQTGHRAIMANLDTKHKQNQDDRKTDREFFQRLVDKLTDKVEKLGEVITDVRIGNARWNIAAGVLTAALIKGMEIFWK